MVVTERGDLGRGRVLGLRCQVSLNYWMEPPIVIFVPMSVAGGLRFHVLGDPTQDPQQETEIFKTVQEWRNPDT